MLYQSIRIFTTNRKNLKMHKITIAPPNHTIPKLSLVAIMLHIMLLSGINSNGQEKVHEPFGRTFNMGMGPSYYSSKILPSPFYSINYEYDIFNNITIAPFVGFASFRSEPSIIASRYYYYRATILPFGIKTTYYLDNLLKIPCRWDVYIACSLGYTYINKKWDYGYPGINDKIPGIREEYLQAGIGIEYHISRNTGFFIDVSTNAATAGISLHKYY